MYFTLYSTTGVKLHTLPWASACKLFARVLVLCYYSTYSKSNGWWCGVIWYYSWEIMSKQPLRHWGTWWTVCICMCVEDKDKETDREHMPLSLPHLIPAYLCSQRHFSDQNNTSQCSHLIFCSSKHIHLGVACHLQCWWHGRMRAVFHLEWISHPHEATITCQMLD